MVNLFAFRATDFDDLKKNKTDNLIGEQNDEYILKAVSEASLVVVAWGEKGTFMRRSEQVIKLLEEANIPVYCLEILKGGQSKHPLYAKGDLIPIPFG